MCADGFITTIDIIEVKSYRAAIAKFRCGNFNLRIRIGVWTDNPRKDRVCRFCENGEFEDEIDFLISVITLMS